MRWTAILILATLTPTTLAQTLQPRAPLPKDAVRALPLLDAGTRAASGALAYRLIVKFRDEGRVRAAQDGGVTAEASFDLGPARAVAAEHGLSFRRLIQTSAARLTALEARAAARSGIAQPDLAGILAVVAPEGAEPSFLETVGARLQDLASVEFAYIQTLAPPPPGDIAPATPSHVGQQTYRGPDPGMNVDFAWTQDVTGAGIRLSDCEYGWVAGHEDLNDIDLHLEPGQTITSTVTLNGWDEHGTAVLGETSAVVNAYGCSGMVPDADVFTYPEWTVEEGLRRLTCITNAIADSGTGDFVLLEMQANGAGGGFGPAELDPAVWTVVKAGTDAGIVVVAAAGNGSQNLDSPAYGPYMARGDSGAIIVGAGTASLSHSALFFSTYGSRVNLQGWGESVFTLGYGTFAQYGGDPNQRYTSSFSGTSSASPFVTSAAIALQSVVVQAGCEPLGPLELRELLVQTGTPQGGGGHIGPLPNLEAALGALDVCLPADNYCLSVPNSTGGAAVISAAGTASIAASDLSLRAEPVPAQQFGVFFYGPEQMMSPFGNGLLCVGGGATGLGRLPVEQASASETLTHNVDYGAPPTATTEITAGSTWHFQAWFRDPAGGGALFDLSDGLTIVFQP